MRGTALFRTVDPTISSEFQDPEEDGPKVIVRDGESTLENTRVLVLLWRSYKSATLIRSRMWRSHTSNLLYPLNQSARSDLILLDNLTLLPFLVFFIFSLRNTFSIPKSFPTSFPIFSLLFRQSIRNFLNGWTIRNLAILIF